MANKKLVDIEKLSRYHDNLNAFLSTKQDVLTDIDDIREGANKGATALQSVPDEYAKKSDVPSIEGLASEEYVDAKIMESIIIAINTEY